MTCGYYINIFVSHNIWFVLWNLLDHNKQQLRNLSFLNNIHMQQSASNSIYSVYFNVKGKSTP